MKRILITSNLFLPNLGGIENSISCMAIEYANAGYEVDIVCSDMNNVSKEILPSFELLKEHVRVFRYKSVHRYIPKSLYMYYSSIQVFKKLRSQHEYECIISRYHFTVITSWLAGFRDIKYLLPGIVKNQRKTERLSTSSSSLSRFLRGVNNFYHHLLQRISLSLVNKLAVFSNNMVKQIKSTFPKSAKKIAVFKPGVDVDKFSCVNHIDKNKLKKELNIPQNKTILLGLGRFVESKGYIYAVEALKYLPSTYVLCLVGEGIESISYKEKAKLLGVLDRLYLFDKTNIPEKYFQASDIFVMSSIYETLGQTVLEAQSCGLPVVAFQPSDKVITSTLEITSGQSTVFSEHLDAESLANAIQVVEDKLTTNELSAIDISASAQEKYSWSALCHNMVLL